MVEKNNSRTQNMPQDSLRSVVYRSFVTCDDPKGVVDCGTIRKSKTHSKKMEHKSESQWTRKNSNTSSTSKEEKKESISMGIKGDLHSPSSLQLLEVSKEAQKLNQTIDSWSKGLSFDGQPKDIAKDILKGALDLQESLVMLGKLQEASQYIAKLKKKHKEKSERERVDEERSQRMNSDRFGDQNYQMGVQNPWHSANGSSRDSFDELRRVIRDGLAKQNLLPNSINEEKFNYDSRRLDSASDIPSTSSSQSSAVYSNNWNKLKKKQEKSDRERVDDEGIERMDSNEFGDQNFQMGFRKSQFSSDGFSRDSVEELKRVIRDSLAKQILLPNPINEEECNFDQRRLDSGSEVPSTSSSQSSMVYSKNLGSIASSRSSVAPEKAKVPNLIAKLMGLEEFPSIPSQSSSEKQLESEKMSIQWRPVSDIGMPKARKPHFVTQKVDPERRTLKEVLETMRFNGLLKSDSVKEHEKVQSRTINYSLSKQRLIDDMPPIVIMKPFHFLCLESEEPLASKFPQKERSLDTHTNDMPRKLNVKEELPPTGIDNRKKISHTNEKHRKLAVEEKEGPIKRLNQAGNAKHSKVVVARSEERISRTKEKASYKIKPSVPVDTKLHKEEATDKQSGKVRKVTLTGKKSAEDNVKSKILLKSQDANVTLTKPSKLESNSNIRKNCIQQQQSTSQNNISKCPKPIKHHNSTDWKKNRTKKGKPVEEPTAANLIMETSECKDDDTKINLSCDNEPVLDIHITTLLAKQLPTEQETVTSKIVNEEHCNDGQSSISLSEITPQTSQHENVAISEEENDHKGHWETESKGLKTQTTLKNMLLSSPSFLSHAEELFDLGMDHPGISQTSAINELEESNVKLLLDCANELMERRSLRESQSAHPLLHTNAGSLSNRISLEQLAEEVYDGVENLRSYSKLGGDNSLIDGVFSMLDRDLNCKGHVISSIWESGWKIGFSKSELEQVVAGTEKLVLGGLIGEIFTDFML